MKSDKKYVVLEHLTLPDRGLRFWSTNSDNNTHSIWGDLWYKEILLTDSEEEAIAASQKMGELPTMHELEEYYNNKLYEQEQEKENNN
jgi:hypothetical protein